MDPLKYGKLLDQTNNKFIINLNTKNTAIIIQNEKEKENFVRIFKSGDLVLEYKDTFISDRSFSRFINDTKFIFENDKLISTQILNALGQFITYEDTNSVKLINPHLEPEDYIPVLSFLLKNIKDPLIAFLV
jgi:hypothetical protein